MTLCSSGWCPGTQRVTERIIERALHYADELAEQAKRQLVCYAVNWLERTDWGKAADGRDPHAESGVCVTHELGEAGGLLKGYIQEIATVGVPQPGAGAAGAGSAPVPGKDDDYPTLDLPGPSAATRAGASAPPIDDPLSKSATAHPLSRRGNHSETAFVAPGQFADSPSPRRKRQAAKLRKPPASADAMADAE